MGEGLCPAPRLVMAAAAAERAASMELSIEGAEAALHRSAPPREEGVFFRRVVEVPASPGLCRDENPFLAELGASLVSGPVCVVAEQPSLKVRAQQHIRPLDIVAVAGHLECEGNASSWRQDQVVANPVKPPLQRSAVTGP